MLWKSAYSVEQMKSMVAQTPFVSCSIDVKPVGFMAWPQKQEIDKGKDLPGSL